MINAANKHQLRVALYATDFHDVTVGDNGFFSAGFPARPGYDIPTRFGTPNATNLIQNLATP